MVYGVTIPDRLTQASAIVWVTASTAEDDPKSSSDRQLFNRRWTRH
jgi:hypothetical protein